MSGPMAVGGSGNRPAGNDTQIQFNDGGVLAGDAGLVWNKATDRLAIQNMTIQPLANAVDTLLINQSGGGNVVTVDTLIPGVGIAGAPENRFNVGVPISSDATADVIFTASINTQTPLVIQGVAGQVANVFETQTSRGFLRVAIDPEGFVGIGTPPQTDRKLSVQSIVTDIAGSDRDGILCKIVARPTGAPTTIGQYNGGEFFALTDSITIQNVTNLVGGKFSSQSQSNSAITIVSLVGGQFDATVQGGDTPTVQDMIGGIFKVDAEDATVTRIRGCYVQNLDVDTGTVVNAYGYYLESPVIGAGSITNLYGIYLENIAGATTLNYAIYTNAGDVLLNAGNGQCDFILRSANYNLIETDSSDDELFLGGNVIAIAAANTIVPFTIRAANTQIVNLQEWQDNAENTYSHVLPSGNLIQRKEVVSKAGAYLATVDDEVIICDATGAPFTISLPAVSGTSGMHFTIKKIDVTANAVTIDGDGAETIDDISTQLLAAQYDSLTIVSDGTEWWII